MAREAEKRRKRATGEPEPAAAHTNAQNMKAGEILRHARLEKGVALEEISSAIHVRVGQLKAIEEDHIDALPGMTYAIGFVKSYASYLKLDAEEIAGRFRAQHGAEQPKPVLNRAEPILESKMPNPAMLGAAAAAVLALVIGWAVFSGGDEVAEEIVSEIPPAPLLAEGPMLTPAPERPAGAESAPVPIPTGPLGAITPVRDIAGAAPVAPVEASGAAAVAAPVPAPKPEAGARPAAAQPAYQPPPAAGPAPQEVINVRRGNSRVVLRATQTTWVQITDASNRVVVKKVLQPGDVFYVPEDANYRLVTTNAGGLDVLVDGKPRKLGDKGDIVRGVKLEPDFLNRRQGRQRSNPFRE